MDMDTPLTELFNLEMPVADDEDIPSTQPEHDDRDECKEETEPVEASKGGWETSFLRHFHGIL